MACTRPALQGKMPLQRYRLVGLQAHVRQDNIATATAIYGFVRELASAIGIVIDGVVFQHGMSTRSSDIKASGASAQMIAQFAGANSTANTLAVKDIPNEAVRQTVKEAVAFSLRNMWIFFTAISIVGIIATLWIKHKTLSEEHTETKTGLKRDQWLSRTFGRFSPLSKVHRWTC